MKIPIKLIALTILLSFTINNIKAIGSNTNAFGNNFWQSIWYIEMDESSTPVRHRFGFKNFYSSREREFFQNKHINQRTQYFRLRIDRDTTQAIGNFQYNPTDIKDFDKQFYQYFPKINLSDPRGGYFIIEDESNCVANELNNINTFCESKFWITYYRNFKLARLAYEQIITDAVALGANKDDLLISFGGPDGLLDSTNWDYFVQKYLTYWCPYRFGIYSHFMLDSNTQDTNKHIYLRNDQVLGPAAVTDDVFHPYLLNNVSGLADCDIRETTIASNKLYIPSEFQTNCISRSFTPSPLGLPPRTPQVIKNYMACWNKDYTGSAIFYTYVGKCKIDKRAFLIVEPASVELTSPTVTFAISCLSSNGTSATANKSYSFSTLRTNAEQDITSDLTTAINQICSYTNSTEKAACNARTVACAVTSITPSYLDFALSLTPTGANGVDTPTNATSGTIAMANTLKIRLNLPLSIVN